MSRLPFGLGPIHGRVGVPEEVLGLVTVGPGNHDTDADRGEYLVPLKAERLSDLPLDPPNRRFYVGGAVDVLEEQGEFVAAQPGYGVPEVDALQQPATERASGRPSCAPDCR